MTPTDPPGPLRRLQLWLAARLGHRYGAAIEIADRALTAFLLTFTAKLLGDGADLAGLSSLTWWQTAATAGVIAGLSIIKSAIAGGLTGSPALLAPVSRTLRARRDAGWRPAYHVPVRPPHRPLPYPHPEDAA